MKERIQQTLLEQYKISELEIQSRKKLFELSDSELEALHDYRFLIEEHSGSIIGRFYELVSQDEHATLLIGDTDTFERLKLGLNKYILDMFSGFYDSEYVNNRLRIGLVHKRIGLEPKYFISAQRYLTSVIQESIRQIIADPDEAWRIGLLVERLISFDTSWIFDTYITSLVDEMRSQNAKNDLYVRSLESKIKYLEGLANKDVLTELYNKRAFRELLRREMLLSKRTNSTISIIYIDVDSFKGINDSRGHETGDKVLGSLGQIIKQVVRETDIPSRQGGDEFCIALLDCALKEAKAKAELIIEHFSSAFAEYSISIGIVEMLDKVDVDVDSLLHRADQKMYLAKKSKGNKICE